MAPETPLRTERARRSALVEIDALVAVWLGMGAETLVAAYRGRFPDACRSTRPSPGSTPRGGRSPATPAPSVSGRTKEHWAQFQALPRRSRVCPRPTGYTAPFHKADREKEMRAAHAVFQARLDAAVARGEWDPVAQEVPQIAVRPTLQARGLKESLLQYLSTTYALSDEGARESLHRFLGDEDVGHVPRPVPADPHPVHRRPTTAGASCWTGAARASRPTPTRPRPSRG